MHLVVANILTTRKDRVLLVRKPGGELATQQIVRPAEEQDIERLLVGQVVGMHTRFQGSSSGVV